MIGHKVAREFEPPIAPPYMDPAEVQVPVWDLSEESGCGHIFGFYDGRQSEAPEP
jgi:hypothetical protein